MRARGSGVWGAAGCSPLPRSVRAGILERSCLSWALQDEDVFTRQMGTAFAEGTQAQTQRGADSRGVLRTLQEIPGVGG